MSKKSDIGTATAPSTGSGQAVLPEVIEQQPMTPEQARALLAAEERAQQQAFINDYNALIARYGWGFTAVPTIDSDGRIKAGLQLAKAGQG